MNIKCSSTVLRRPAPESYWWRRAPETARIVATEVGWQVGSF